ncbi:methylmalonyl-CoA mutase small subunit [Streptomyces oryzae]|uniref:Methylmalonyl-CoA mutase small subunit n=1 Tax=Streptomyces oryzae TaxID=1434886 RepID=A0ABS3XGY1_9ACTN|nr:methylmalonyl-CoA mutase family protein [Streptomyces oryzae]MBO8194660.1 methylmalonyl-CoA mutase small subunit [Streptomyces oryzae]
MTVPPEEGLSLGQDFPEATYEQWQQLVSGVLSKTGAKVPDASAPESALTTTLPDGIEVRPLYTGGTTTNGNGGPRGFPGFAPFVRGARPEANAARGWDIRQRHTRADAAGTREAVLGDLENGVTSLWLAVGEGGLPIGELEGALEGVYFDLAPIVLDAGAEFGRAAAELLRLRGRLPGGAEPAPGSVLGADPLGHAARTGAHEAATALRQEAAALAAQCEREQPGLRTYVVDTLPYHEAGGTPARELGCALATGVAYLRDMTEAGLPVAAACGQLEFRYAATADQFTTIAALRATRRLWSRVVQACGAPAHAGAQRQHAVTSPVMMTRRDPWVNMLRTTVATLAAGVGGADAVTVLPFDDALGLPDAFARRIARNTSTILLEESHLAGVIDPAGGSWYVEELSDQLARAAWAWFQEIEGAGGMAAALRDGLVAERLREGWAERSRALARRTEPVTGVSEFPLLDERPVEREPAPQRPGGGLPRVRRDDAYEALRARSDAHLAATGERPKLFIAALGPAAAHTARVSFVANLARAGGIEPVHEPVTVDAAGAPEAFRGSGAQVACLCSSDDLYAEQAAGVAAALKAAGATRVLLAGKPKDAGRRAEYEGAGVDEFVHAGGDAVALLTSLLDCMGVEA